MSQPEIRIVQMDQIELTSFVDGRIASSNLTLHADVSIGSPIVVSEVLTWFGSPESTAVWTNRPGGNGGVGNIVGGDGIIVTTGSPQVTIDVDATVARRNASNTFTTAVSGISTAGIVLQSTAPGYILVDTGSPSLDESVWRMFSSGGTLTFDARNDANDAGNNWMVVTRQAENILSVEFPSQVILSGSPAALIASNATGPAILNEAASSTNAVIIPNRNDIDTGIGWTSSNRGALVANSILVAEFTENVGGAGRPQIILNTTGAFSSQPNLAFGDGDSGFFELSDDTIGVSIAGTSQYQFTATEFGGSGTSEGTILTTTSSSTVPGHTFRSDPDTGVGRAGTDAVSVIAGGVEAMRFTEASSSILQAVEIQGALSAAGSPQVQGNNPILSSNNIFTTVNEGDITTLPATFIAGTRVHIKNDGANSLNIYPASGDDLGQGSPGIDQPIVLAPNSHLLFTATTADTTWTTFDKAGSGWQTIEQQVASNSSSIDFVLPSEFTMYRVYITTMVPASDDEELYCRFSNDGGGTFRAGASDYGYAIETQGAGGTGAALSSTGAAQILLAGTTSGRGIGNAAGESANYVFLVNGAQTSARSTQLISAGSSYIGGNGSFRRIEGGGRVVTAEVNNAVRFIMSSGNITSGTFILEGLVS